MGKTQSRVQQQRLEATKGSQSCRPSPQLPKTPAAAKAVPEPQHRHEANPRQQSQKPRPRQQSQESRPRQESQEPKPRQEPQSQREPNPRQEPQSQREPKPRQEPQSQREPKTRPEPQSQRESKPKPGQEPQSQREPKPRQEPKPQQESKPQQEAKSRQKPESEQKPGQEHNSSPRRKPVPKPFVPATSTRSQQSQAQPTVNSPAPLTSETYRFEGNGFYRQYVSSTNIPDQKKFLQSAIRCYRQAYTTACENEGSHSDAGKNACTAAKNCATGLCKLVRIFVQTKTSSTTIEIYYRDAIEFFSKALANGKTCMDEKWIKDIKNTYAECIQSSLHHAQNNLDKDKRYGAIEQQIQVMAENSQKAKCFWEIADMAFQEGVVALGTRDFKAALHAFHECYRPISELKHFLPFADGPSQYLYTKEVAVMEDDVSFHLATAESLQAITIGDELLEVATGDKNQQKLKSANMDLVYDVIDWYRKAVLGTREIEVEVEAMALSRLGSLYDSVLKLKYKAKEYFLRCVQLGISLYRKDTESEDWFKTSMSTLKRYQEEAAKNDDVAQQQERQKYLDELVVELAKLKSANTTSIELIRFVYKTFPPKDPNHTVPEEELKNDNVKKGLLKAILHYHPDKQNVAENGKKWQTLCGEITRTFTERYEAIKFS